MGERISLSQHRGCGAESINGLRNANWSVYYAIALRMLSNHARVSLLDCEGETGWDDCVGLLPFDQSQSLYWAANICYPAKQKLNGRIENYLRSHHRGHFIEGVILSSGLAKTPEYYRDGAHALFKITFHDQFGRRSGLRPSFSCSARTE
jgi:hypothetical protein